MMNDFNIKCVTIDDLRRFFAYIFAAKCTFVKFFNCLDMFDVDGAEGFFPWNTLIIIIINLML